MQTDNLKNIKNTKQDKKMKANTKILLLASSLFSVFLLLLLVSELVESLVPLPTKGRKNSMMRKKKLREASKSASQDLQEDDDGDGDGLPQPGEKVLVREKEADPELEERVLGNKAGYIAPRYRRAMMASLEAERRLYKCRFANASQRIGDLNCFDEAIRKFAFNATWYKQAAITSRVGGFVQRAFQFWNASLFTVLEARGFVQDKIPAGALPPISMLRMMHRAAPQDANELAKVWVEVLQTEGKLKEAREIVEDFILPPNWQDLDQEVFDPETKTPLRNENRTWVGHLTPFEAGEVYRSLLAPTDAAAAQSFMNRNSDLVKKRTQMVEKRRREAEEAWEAKSKGLSEEEKRRFKTEKLGIHAPTESGKNPLLENSNADAAGLSFASLLAEHLAMTAELLIRDTLQATSIVKAAIRKKGRSEFEQVQRQRCGRAFYARAGGIVKWGNAVRFIEDCVMKWPHLDQWLSRDNQSELLVKQYPGFHAVSHAETHLFAALGTPRLLALVLNFTGPQGGAIEDAMRQTPLHYATANGHASTTSIVMGFGVSPTVHDVGRVQPLYHLCRQPHLKKLFLDGHFSMPPGSPDPKIACRDKHVYDLIQAAEREPRREEPSDNVDHSGGGWLRLKKLRDGDEQKCDKRIEMRSVFAVNENEFIARHVSGSEPLIMRSEFKSVQKFFSKKSLMAYRNEELTKKILVRVEIVPEAEKFGSGLATNQSLYEFISNLKKRSALRKEKEREKSGGSSSNKKNVSPAMFGVADITEEHPFGELIWGSLKHNIALKKLRNKIGRFVSAENKKLILDEQEKEESERDKKEEQAQSFEDAKDKEQHDNDNNNNKKKEEEKKEKTEKKISNKKKKKATKSAQLGELFRPPFSPRNRTSLQSLKQSYFTPVTTASLEFLETGAQSNFVTSFVGRVHTVIHGEQEIMLLPPSFSVTTRDPVSVRDFDQDSQKAKDIYEPQMEDINKDKKKGSSNSGVIGGWHSKSLFKCVLLAGDVLFVPPFWGFAFGSSNGESVSVTGKITYR